MSFPRYYEFPAAEAQRFYFLNRGSLRLSSLSSTGKERVIMYMEADNIFGEVVHLHESRVHCHSLRALEKIEVIGFPIGLLSDIDFCRHYPHLILNLVHSLGIKAGAFFCQISDVALLESHTQVCRMLYQIWKENGEPRVFDPGISQSDIADILGMHRSSLTRALRMLRDDGVIGVFSKKRLEVVNPQRLMELAEVILVDNR